MESSRSCVVALTHYSTEPLTTGPDYDPLLLLIALAGDVHPNTGPPSKYPCKSRSPLSGQSVVGLSGFSASGQFEVAQLILITATKTRPDQTQLLLLQMEGDVHPNPSPASKYPCPVCTRNVTSRGVSYQCNICCGWVYAICSGILNAAQYLSSQD